MDKVTEESPSIPPLALKLDEELGPWNAEELSKPQPRRYYVCRQVSGCWWEQLPDATTACARFETRAEAQAAADLANGPNHSFNMSPNGAAMMNTETLQPAVGSQLERRVRPVGGETKWMCM